MRGPILALSLMSGAWLGGCAGTTAPPRAADLPAGRAGIDPIPAVHLFENHSSSLILWRRAEVRNRVLVHIDGHADFDWLPDETIARIAAARPHELAALELHPYAMDGSTHRSFGIWNFIYPAARLGMVRQVFWIVPDGTLADRDAAARLILDLFVGKLQELSLEEAGAIQFDGRRIRATLIGVPFVVCELDDLPPIDEPVLLDVDVDYFTTRSATSQEITAEPWIDPRRVLETLGRHGVRADIATVSLSTMGGFLPPAQRWIGSLLQRGLHTPGAAPDDASRSAAFACARRKGAGTTGAIGCWREYLASRPDDATGWLELARAEAAVGTNLSGERAMARAVELDPVLLHAELFEADRLWMNGSYEAALDRYRAYLADLPSSPFFAYALRREAGCLMRLNRDAEAVATFRRVVEAAPEHGDTRLDLGVLLRQLGHFDEATEQLRAARAILPELGTYALALGTTYHEMGRLDEAIEEIEQAVTRRPCWPPARVNLASALADAGRFDDAMGQLRVARVLQPATPQLLQLERVIRTRAARPVAASARP